LAAALARHPSVASGNLELEILESAAIDDLANASHTLANCIALGVHFALDDFGTGYSSLAYFRKLPVGVLKIDQGFVRGMLDDPEDLGIIESVLSLAKAFNRPVIAEGVETLEHGAMLVMLGCRLGQGYGIARPMPANDLPDWVAQWHGEDIWRTLGEYALPPQDLVLMVAARSHLKWIEAFAQHVAQPSKAALPILLHTQCPFGRWYYGSGLSRYGRFAEFSALEKLHSETHALATAISAQINHGERDAAHARLGQLQQMHQALAAGIDQLIARVRASGPTPPN
jgi:hypothetical protein